MNQRKRSRQIPQIEVKAKIRFKSPILWISLGLIAVNVFIYAQVLNHEFVNFDDNDYVYANPNVLAGFTWNGFRWALTTETQGNWHPLTWLSHITDAQLYGLNAGAHHATSVFLHILNSVMLFWILHRMTSALGRSAFVAAVFAAHPLHVESVAWVSERKDVLSTILGLLTIWAYLRYVGKPAGNRYLPVLLLYALGLMAKPMLVTLPFLLLLLDFWPLDRAKVESGVTNVLKLIHEKVPLLALAGLSSIITFIVQRRAHAVSGFEALPLGVRVENAIVSYVAYLSKIFWPAGLSPFYPYSTQRLESWILGLAGVIAVSGLAMTLAKRYAYFFVGWFWFLGALFPVIGLVQVGRQSMADRYTYVPLIGVAIIVAWGLPDVIRRLPWRAATLAATAGLAILMSALAARAQVQYWKNSLTMWNRALQVTSDNYIAHHGLAAELGLQGKTDEAIAHLTEALRINPNYAEAHYNLGVELVNKGNWDEASTQFSEAIRLDPNHASARNNLANILLAKGRQTEAMAQYAEALRISPDYVDARSNLAYALIEQGKTDDAKRELLEILRIDPMHANALQMMEKLKNK